MNISTIKNINLTSFILVIQPPNDRYCCTAFTENMNLVTTQLQLFLASCIFGYKLAVYD